MTQKIKDDVVVVHEKDEFEYVLQTTLANTIAIISPGHLNSSVFHCL